MTEEQFKRAVEINNRLKALKEVKDEIDNVEKYRLSYMYRDCDGNFTYCSGWKMKSIKELFDKHDRMIREEIDEEIKKLQEEIKTL